MAAIAGMCGKTRRGRTLPQVGVGCAIGAGNGLVAQAAAPLGRFTPAVPFTRKTQNRSPPPQRSVALTVRHTCVSDRCSRALRLCRVAACSGGVAQRRVRANGVPRLTAAHAHHTCPAWDEISFVLSFAPPGPAVPVTPSLASPARAQGLAESARLRFGLLAGLLAVGSAAVASVERRRARRRTKAA